MSHSSKQDVAVQNDRPDAALERAGVYAMINSHTAEIQHIKARIEAGRQAQQQLRELQTAIFKELGDELKTQQQNVIALCQQAVTKEGLQSVIAQLNLFIAQQQQQQQQFNSFIAQQQQQQQQQIASKVASDQLLRGEIEKDKASLTEADLVRLGSEMARVNGVSPEAAYIMFRSAKINKDLKALIEQQQNAITTLEVNSRGQKALIEKQQADIAKLQADFAKFKEQNRHDSRGQGTREDDRRGNAHNNRDSWQQQQRSSARKPSDTRSYPNC
jgi:hypothetical protein